MSPTGTCLDLDIHGSIIAGITAKKITKVDGSESSNVGIVECRRAVWPTHGRGVDSEKTLSTELEGRRDSLVELQPYHGAHASEKCMMTKWSRNTCLNTERPIIAKTRSLQGLLSGNRGDSA